MAQESLVYLRRATMKQDGATGFVYRHRWATGYQDLVFATQEKADEFRAARERAA